MAHVRKVFISYRRDDADMAGRMRDWLVKSWHIPRENVFMDVTTLLPGSKFTEVIEQAISQCQAMIVIMSPSWLLQIKTSTTSFVRFEVETALNHNVLVIPVLVGGLQVPTKEQLPASLLPLLRRNIRPVRPESFEYDMEWVRKGLGIRSGLLRLPVIASVSAALLIALSVGTLSQLPITNPPNLVYAAVHPGSATTTPTATAPLIPTDTPGPTATPTPAPLSPQSVVFFGSTDHTIYAINAVANPNSVTSNDCSLRWRYPVGSHASSTPVIAGNVMYMGSFDHYVYAIDIRTGRLIWRFQASGRIVDSPTVANGLVFAGADGGILYALRTSDGSQAWTFQRGSSLGGSPVVLGDSVIIGASTGLYAVDMTSGQQQWAFSGGGTAYSPLVSNNIIYVGGSDNALHAIDPTTGQELWKFQAGGQIQAAPAVRQDFPYIVFGALDGKVYEVSLSSHQTTWTFQTQGPIYSSPTVAGDVVYIGSVDHNLYALNYHTGAEYWVYTAYGIIQTAPAVANSVVYVTSVDGNLYALRDNVTSVALLCKYTTSSGIYSSPVLNP